LVQTSVLSTLGGPCAYAARLRSTWRNGRQRPGNGMRCGRGSGDPSGREERASASTEGEPRATRRARQRRGAARPETLGSEHGGRALRLEVARCFRRALRRLGLVGPGPTVRRLTFNHQCRFGRPFRGAKQLLDDGVAGRPERVEFAVSDLYDYGSRGAGDKGLWAATLSRPGPVGGGPAHAAQAPAARRVAAG